MELTFVQDCKQTEELQVLERPGPGPEAGSKTQQKSQESFTIKPEAECSRSGAKEKT